MVDFYQIHKDVADAFDTSINSSTDGVRYFNLYNGCRRTVVILTWEALDPFLNEEKEKLTLKVVAIDYNGCEAVIAKVEWFNEVATGLNWTTVETATKDMISRYLW